MSKRQFKSQASSARAASGAFGGSSQNPGLGTPAFGAIPSTLSFVAEPPDLTAISDPNVVVAFKNLSKKDNVTKAKALEDLQTYVLSVGVQEDGLEDQVLEAWVKIYPRISIDNSRRVRQLAHTLHGQIAVSCGKRVARHVPKVVGAWLGGLYDNDRLVSKAAQQSFKQVFPTQEKVHNVWRSYARPILEYCRDALLRETVQTLSDERTVSPDEAENKYAALVGTTLSVVINLAEELAPEENEKIADLYREILGQEKVWDLASSKDASVRRSLYKLLRTALSHQPELVRSNISTISTCLLAKSLNIDQTGSAYEYSETLLSLTRECPIAWTGAYTAKKAALVRLQQLLKRGSQGGPPEYWSNISEVFQKLPRKIMPNDLAAAKDLLDTVRVGIARKDEPKWNVIAAWNAYAIIASHLLSLLPGDKDQENFLGEAIFPLLERYIRPNTEDSAWSIGSQGPTVCASFFHKLYYVRIGGVKENVFNEWRRLGECVVKDIRLSLPEQSQSHSKSQDDLSSEGHRWFLLQAEILKDIKDDSVATMLAEISNHILDSAVGVLTARNGKPYGAAAIIEAALRLQPTLLDEENDNSNGVATFVFHELPSLILSPSSQYLLAILYEYRNRQAFGPAWNDTVRTLLGAQNSPEQFEALRKLLSSPGTVHHINEDINTSLKAFITQNFNQAMGGNPEKWTIVTKVLSPSNTVLSQSTKDDILSEMVNALSVEGKASAALQGLDLLAKEHGTKVETLVSTKHGSRLLSNLLFLTESPDDSVAEMASSVSASFESILSDKREGSSINMSLLAVLNKGINEAGSNSISIESLVDRARQTLEQAPEQARNQVAMQLLPDSAQWAAAVRPFLKVTPNPSFAITSPLGSAVSMITNTSEASDTATLAQLPHDSEGYSAAIRMAWYTMSIIKATNIFEMISPERRSEVYQNLIIMVQLADDNLSLAGANHLWVLYTPEVEAKMLDFILGSQSLLRGWLEPSGSNSQPLSGGNFVNTTLDYFSNNSFGTSALAYYSARIMSVVNSQLAELQGYSKQGALMRWNGTVRDLRKSKDIFFTSSLLTDPNAAMSDSVDLVRLCNELIAELTGLKLSQNTDEGLRQLVLLNALLQHHQDVIGNVAQQRLVFLVKTVCSWLSQEFAPRTVITEVLKLSTVVLPLLKEIYGSHWADALTCLAELWANNASINDEQLPAIHASLKLYAATKMLVGDDANDDLADAWQEFREPLSKGLIHLLKQVQNVSDDQHQPLRIVNELLARQTISIPLEALEDPTELYPLLYANSRSIQGTAFGLLERHIPTAQEQISFDAALTKKDTYLPAELLSLILSAPTLDSLADVSFERTMPLPLRGYLLSWLLVFSHFTNSSLKVKTDYVANLKEGGYITGLLDLMFDFLGLSNRRPVDASKFEITTYDPNNDEVPEKDTQWVLIHLYYLSLRHIPSLAKNWWLDCKSRQVKLAVETWTERHISPLIVTAELANVSEWAPTQEDEDKILVKISNKAKEVSVAYEVDEQAMQILIRLPGAYPLHLATVEGVHRVGVTERQWRSWLIITQGVIAFSNGNLIDGLLTWRRNIRGALKGQTECSICYSIISADKQLPTKRCGTCKNMFHSDCLYKWFKSSNGSTCPLCRNQFNYDK
ncbi:MAG: hypothetical protein M1836_005543 [Candelina mexicana]|nr:MAG: hypothetical protein M1836_005543 [Candelina mexicana]